MSVRILAAILCLLSTAAQAQNYEYSGQGSLAQIGVTPALHGEVTGAGIRIANLDGSADVTHSDLAGQVTPIKLYSGVYRNPFAHNNWHATLTTGIMIARRNGMGTVGVAPGAHVVNYAVHDDRTSYPWVDRGKRVFANIVQRNAAGANIRIVNLEYSTTDESGPHVQAQPWLNGELELLDDYARDFVVVKASGNQGKALKNVYYPPGNPGTRLAHLIMVGNANASNARMSDSSFPGGACFYNIAVSRCVAGNYLSEFLVTSPGTVRVPVPGGGWTALPNGGGSSAMAHVAGALALLFQDAARRGKSLSPAQAVSIVKRSATDLGAPGTDGVYGRGMLNVPAALALSRSEP